MKMRKILQYILKILAKLVLLRHKPVVVAVTGSVGKTTTKEAIYYVLRKQFLVRRNLKNYNNEIGVPLTILGSYSSPETLFSHIFSWLKIFFKAILTIIKDKKYPEILILEMGVSKPGDMEYLLSFVPVKVGIFTAIGQFPSHIEFFPEKGRLVQEKALLIKLIPKNGLAVLNYDDLSVRSAGEELPEKIKKIFYGFGSGADLRIMNYEMKTDDFMGGDFGINFKLDRKGSVVPVFLNKILGEQYAFASAAAASVGLFFGLNLVEISTALRKYRVLPGRTKIIKGIKETRIIDDSYNAAPSSTIAAMGILKKLPLKDPSSRKIAALGDMLELGEDTEAAHCLVGQKAAKSVNLLFTVGERARFIANEAEKNGLPKKNIYSFSTSKEAALSLQKKLNKGDIILVKGSRGMKMEEITREIMSRPEKAKKLLVS